jgi:membrane protein DedA with SNARE-associated domain
MTTHLTHWIAGHAGPSLIAVIAAGTLGSLAGSLGGWALGRVGGRRLIRLVRSFVSIPAGVLEYRAFRYLDVTAAIAVLGLAVFATARVRKAV